MAARRPDGDTDSNFPCTPRDFVGEQAVDACTGQHYCKYGKEAGELRNEAFHKHLPGKLLCFRSNLIHGEIGIAASDDVADGADQLLWITGRTNGKTCRSNPWRV